MVFSDLIGGRLPSPARVRTRSVNWSFSAYFRVKVLIENAVCLCMLPYELEYGTLEKDSFSTDFMVILNISLSEPNTFLLPTLVLSCYCALGDPR